MLILHFATQAYLNFANPLNFKYSSFSLIASVLIAIS